ncbi:MAG: hypothetical protein DMF56_23690 [Acidobacteria bacterium]|nr:MAG: hypothetical protein DMF56_23690 [Acidobacteriota bacterium]
MIERIQIAADMGEVTAARHLEIPVQGPGRANLLVCINGITLKGFDTDEDFRNGREPTDIEIFIDTDYKLRDDDVLLYSTAYSCLASMGTDDDTGFQLALDQSFAEVRTSRVVRIRLTGTAEGDTAIYRIGYQANLLLARTR